MIMEEEEDSAFLENVQIDYAMGIGQNSKSHDHVGIGESDHAVTELGDDIFTASATSHEGSAVREEEEEEKEGHGDWCLFGQMLPKNEVIFICQVVILYIVILTCIVNLSMRNGDSNLWTALLSSSLGVMLPHPTISKRK